MPLLRIARSSISGRFVSLWYALTHPKTTTVEETSVPDETEQR